MKSGPEILYQSKYMTVTQYRDQDDKNVPPPRSEIHEAIKHTRCNVYHFSVRETTDKKHNMQVRYGILVEQWCRSGWEVVYCMEDVTDSLMFAEKLALRCNERHIYPHEIKDELQKLKWEEILCCFN